MKAAAYSFTVVTLTCIVMYYMLTQTVTDPTYQAGMTAREQARQQTQRVQAEQWGATVRGTVPWLAGGVAAAAMVGVGGWMIVEWQRERTKRAATNEDHTTQRHLISAKRDIALAYIAVCGDPGAELRRIGGVDGVYLPESNELVPLDVCRVELTQRRFLITGGAE